MKKIMVDMDEVITTGNFNKVLEDYLGHEVDDNSINGYYIQDVLGDKKEDFFNYFKSINLYENAELLPDCYNVLKKLSNVYQIYICTDYIWKEIIEQVEKIQELIEMNSRVAQNQEKYKKEYDAIIKTYDETKAKYEQLEIEISKQAAKHQMIKDYINTLKKQTKLLEKFDGLLWGSLLESATIKDKDTIVFKFKDGTEING